MSKARLVGMVWLLSLHSLAQAAEPVTVASQSGQFLVKGIALAGWSVSPPPTGATFVNLDAAVLAVTCERIKQVLLTRLESTDAWRGAVQIMIQPARRDDEPIEVRAIHYTDGWQYRLGIPERVDRKRLTQTLVEVMLLEMANRRAGARAVELPPWLGPGLTALLAAESDLRLALDPESLTFGHRRRGDPIKRLRQSFKLRAPLTLSDLNWPTPESFLPENEPDYVNSAHLLVYELLRLPNGPQRMMRMLEILPDYLNWQMAFLQAFQDDFPRMIELDKWWSLILIQMAGRSVSSNWSSEESWRKFEDALSTSVQVRTRTDELPMATKVNFQAVIREWEYRRQIPHLRLKINHLEALRLRVSQDLVGLVDDYRQVLKAYLDERTASQAKSPEGESDLPDVVRLVERTVKRLDQLDQNRETIRRLIELATSGRK